MKPSKFRKLETILVGSLGLAALLVGIYAVLVRHFMPHMAAGWADELVVYLIMWAIWISSARLVADNCHVHADILVRRLPASWQKKLLFLNNVLGFIFCAVIAYAAWQVVMLAIQLGEKSESALQFPQAFYYMSLWAGMLLMAARYFEKCWEQLNNNDENSSENLKGTPS